MKFVKKPVEIEATQWFKNGDHPEDHDGFGEAPFTNEMMEHYADYLQTEGKVVRYFRSPQVSGSKVCVMCGKTFHEHGWVDTLEGGHIVCPGDWIITGVKGEHYPCKPDIFEMTYEAVENENFAPPSDDDFLAALGPCGK